MKVNNESPPALIAQIAATEAIAAATPFSIAVAAALSAKWCLMVLLFMIFTC